MQLNVNVHGLKDKFSELENRIKMSKDAAAAAEAAQ